MKILKKLSCVVFAAAMCFNGLQIRASADAMPAQDAWYVGGWYVINSDGVYGYSYDYVLRDGAREETYSFSRGYTVYVKYGVNRMGINWADCSSDTNQYADGFILYGWVDMSYLTPYDEYFAPEPETDPPTDPPTEPPTEAPTTKKATTAATTAVTTALMTIATTKTQTTTTSEKAKAVLSTIDNRDDYHNSNFLSDNFPFLLIGGVVLLLAASGALAIGIICYNRKKQSMVSNQIYNEQAEGQQQIDVKYCPQCGTPNTGIAAFCKKCGTLLK